MISLSDESCEEVEVGQMQAAAINRSANQFLRNPDSLKAEIKNSRVKMEFSFINELILSFFYSRV